MPLYRHCYAVSIEFYYLSYHAQQFNCSLNFYVDLVHAVMHRKTDWKFFIEHFARDQRV